jgi:hypothetical protein
LDFSPVKGPEGNIEYLLYLTTGTSENKESWPEDSKESGLQATNLQGIDVDGVVIRSHAALDSKNI